MTVYHKRPGGFVAVRLQQWYPGDRRVVGYKEAFTDKLIQLAPNGCGHIAYYFDTPETWEAICVDE